MLYRFKYHTIKGIYDCAAVVRYRWSKKLELWVQHRSIKLWESPHAWRIALALLRWFPLPYTGFEDDLHRMECIVDREIGLQHLPRQGAGPRVKAPKAPPKTLSRLEMAELLSELNNDKD